MEPMGVQAGLLTTVLATRPLISVASALFLLLGKQDRQAEALLFLLVAVVALSRALFLAFRHRPYRHSLAAALVLLAISGLLTLMARLTPEPVPVKTATHTLPLKPFLVDDTWGYRKLAARTGTLGPLSEKPV